MALKKTNYVNGKTVISAENLNDIQDAVLDLESKDGVGMGITGATVGQIAKVAARWTHPACPPRGVRWTCRAA